MAYKKFFPTSNDPFLLADADMALAKFGHLNSLINYVNSEEIISGYGATATLTANQSTTVILLDRAAGTTFTLPSATVNMVGTNFTFFRNTTLSANSVVNTSGTDTFVGTVVLKKTTVADNFYTSTTNKTFTETFTTVTAGIVGSTFTITCIAAGKWAISGNLFYSGTAATPFSN